jgi:hypothetical protein
MLKTQRSRSLEQPEGTDMLDPMDKEVTIALRVSKEERADWEQAAAADGRKLSDWIRRRCNGLESSKPRTTYIHPVTVQLKPSKKGGK